MIEFIENFEKNCTNTLRKHEAIILCNCNEIIDSLNYNDVITITNQISDFLTKNIKSNCCIGLIMSHNLYLPSIIISIHHLKHAFMFLTKDSDICNILNHVDINWLLSFDCNLKNYKMIDNIQLHQYNLYLYQCDSVRKFNYHTICYVISTSGTTGDKKYVRVTNDCIDDNIKSLNTKFQLTKDDVIYFGTPLTFDPSMVELLLALYNYSTLLIVDENRKFNPIHLYKTLFPLEFQQQQNQGVTFLQTVPSLFLRWSEQQIRYILNRSRLKILALGGEKFPQQILELRESENLRLFNLYGITEVSCWATIFEIPYNRTGQPSIGEPLGETVIQIRDDHEGEIMIGSSKRICFIGDEIKLNGTIFRKTGDLGLEKSGEIFYLNRRNDTIKRYGHKISLGRVEGMIEKITGLSNKCVWCVDKLLNFLIVSEFDCGIRRKILDKLRVRLLRELPREYFPDYFEILPKFPTTGHGKIDTNVLETIYLNRHSKSDPCDYFKLLLCEYFGLNLDQLPSILSKHFFDIGGNSIIVLQFINEFSQNFYLENQEEFVRKLFENNLEQCLDFIRISKIDKKRKFDDNSPKPIKKVKPSDFGLEIQWTYNLEACVDCTPIIFNYNNENYVAVGSFAHIFVILNCKTSQILSKFILPNVIENSICFTNNSNILVGCYDGNLYCLDFIKSTILWQFSTGDIIKTKPIICCDNTKIICCSYDKFIYCIKINSGSCVWKTTISEIVLATPICFKNEIYVATTQGSCCCLLENSGDIRWKIQLNQPIFGSPCLYGGCFIAPGVLGDIYCLSINNGEELWRIKCGNNIFSSIITHEDYLLLNCHDCNLYLIKFERSKPEVHRIFLDDISSTTPLICNYNDRKIVVTATNRGVINLIDFNNKDVLTELKLPSQVFSSPVYEPINNSIYLGCRDNNLYRICFKSK